MFREQDAKSDVMISTEGVATSSLPAAGVVITKDNLPAGAVVMVDAGNRRLDATAYGNLAATDYFRIAQGLGTTKPLYLSGKIRKDSFKLTAKPHRAATEQITRIGYGGSAALGGSLPTANDTSYWLKIRKNDNDAANRSQPTNIHAQFKTDASATQYELAFGLVGNLIKNLSLEPANGYIRAEVLIDTAASNTAFGGLGNATGNPAFTNGSKVVIMADTQDLSAGDYFRVSASATEALTDPVYRIVSVDSATQITLDIPYQGVTAAALDDDFVHLIPAATGDADNFGIQLTGVAADFDVAAFRDFYKNRFTASFSDSNTLNSHIQGASEGVGAWQRVQLDEYYAQWGNEGQAQMSAVPPRAREQEATASVKYSAITLAYTEEVTRFIQASGFDGSLTVYLQLDTADPATLTNANTGFELAITVLAAGGATSLDEV